MTLGAKFVSSTVFPCKDTEISVSGILFSFSITVSNFGAGGSSTTVNRICFVSKSASIVTS